MTLLTPRDVAKKLNVSTRTVYNWLEEGRLPAVRLSERITRVPEEAVEALVTEATQPLIAAEERAQYGSTVTCLRCGSEVDPTDNRSPTQQLRERVSTHSSAILELASKHHIVNVRLIGSVARGDAVAGSDIDLLVDIEPGVALFDLAAFEFEAGDEFEWDVHVVSSSDLPDDSRDRILVEAVAL